MTRLIDADALYKEFKQRQNAALRWKEKAILDNDEERQIRADATLCFLSEVKLTIDNAPTVEERPKGEWVKCSLGFDCNKCGYTQIYEDNICEYHFCPNCGADMKEADND